MEREVLQQSFPLYSGKHSQVSFFKHAVLITVISQRRKKKDRKEKKKNAFLHSKSVRGNDSVLCMKEEIER